MRLQARLPPPDHLNAHARRVAGAAGDGQTLHFSQTLLLYRRCAIVQVWLSC